MKYKQISFFLLIGGMLAFSPLLSSISLAETVSFSAKTTDGLNVRKGPGTSYAKISHLESGASVQVYEQKNGWDRISTSQQWVADEYLKKVSSTTFSAKVSTNILFVRSGPGKNYDKISQLKSGAAVQVYEQKNGWDRISTSQQWVAAEYLKRTVATAVKKVTSTTTSKTTTTKPATASASTPKPASTQTAAAAKPSTACLNAVKNANTYCKSIASGCNSYNTSAHCVEANKKCAEQQEEALELCPV